MEQSGWGRVAVSRRRVVVTGGVVAAGAALTADQLLGSVVDELVGDAAARFRPGSIRVERIRRGQDLLVANLVIANLTHTVRNNKPVLVASREPGYLTLILPGQSLGEEAPTDSFYVARRARAELALPTVLAFTVEAGQQLPYELAALLDLAALKPVNGVVRRNGQIVSPGTGIEAPYRLLIKPHSTTRWLNDTAPKYLSTDGGPTTAELWHTRLAGQAIRATSTGPKSFVDQRGTLSKVVAVPNRHLSGEDPVATPLTDNDRKAIVQNAHNFKTTYEGDLVSKAPVRADEVILSALGATLDLHGLWPGATNSTAKWDHRATLGRDNYVRVVKVGWLAPYRHRAVLVTVTERRMMLSPPLVDVERSSQALLVKRLTLIVIDPIADTDLEALRQKNGRTTGLPFPFTDVECRQAVTSGLTADGDIANEGGMPLQIVGGVPRPLRLPFVGRDHLGRSVPFTSAVWFVPGQEQNRAGALDPVSDEALWDGWNDVAKPDRRADTGGLPVAIAPEDPDHRGLSTVPLTNMLMKVVTLPGAYPPWRPEAATLSIDSPGINALGGGGPVEHSYHTTYADDQDNRGGVVLGTAEGGAVDKETAGGLVALPKYQGLSRTSGSIMAQKPGALDKLGGINAPDAAAIIKDLFEGIYLLGPLQLSDIVKPVAGMFDVAARAGGAPGNSIPSVTHEVRGGRVYVDLDLTLPMQFWRAPGGVLAFRPTADSFRVKAHVESGGSGPTETSIDARLQKVAVEFAGVIAIPIAEFRARIGTGGKSFDFEIENVQFLGELAFLQPLSNLINLGAVKGGTKKLAVADARRTPYTDRAGAPVATTSSGQVEGVDAYVDEDGLHLAAGFSVPDVPLGVFSLSGLNFGIAVDLPFGEGVEIHAWFASHEDPFQVTYCGFGGGGYVDIVIGELENGKPGLKKVTASIFVSARLGIDLVVASGELSVRVGLVLTLESGKSVSISAYFRISGSVSIPLVCSVSVTFELTLEFVPGIGPGERTMINGSATFMLDVQVLIVSGEYEATLSKTFKGGRNGFPLSSGSDPFRSLAETLGNADALDDEDVPLGFLDVHPTPETWQDFAAAFATA